MGIPSVSPQSIKRDNFQFGYFDAVPTRDLLIRDGHNYPLEPLVMDVLCILAEQPGDVIMRDDLINRIWDVDHGGDESLTRAISVLRKTLRDAGAEDDYIETIPKRGYRLVQSVNPQPKTPPSEGASSTSLVNNSGSILPVMLLILLAGLALLVIAAIRF